MHRTSLVLALLGAAPLAHAQTSVVLPADRDNTLYESNTGDLSNGSGQWFFAGNTQAVEARRGLLRFDLSSIPVGAEIMSARVELFMDRTMVGPVGIGLHPVLADWGEGTSDALGQEGGGAAATPGDATWTHAFDGGAAWATDGGDFEPGASATTSVGGFGSYAWTGAGLASDVQAWIDGTADNYGWLLLADENVTPGAKRFASREHPDSSIRPRLVVEYVPAPGALALLTLAPLARRRR